MAMGDSREGTRPRGKLVRKGGEVVDRALRRAMSISRPESLRGHLKHRATERAIHLAATTAEINSMSVRTRRGRRRRRFAVRRAARVCRFRCAGRRDGSRCGTNRRFTRRPIRRRWRRLGPGKFRPFLQPGLVFGRVVHHEHPFHAVMTEAAELAANHFEAAFLDRLEPHRNDLARNRVLRDPQGVDREIVDHVLRGKLDNNRPIDRHVQFLRLSQCRPSPRDRLNPGRPDSNWSGARYRVCRIGRPGRANGNSS